MTGASPRPGPRPDARPRPRCGSPVRAGGAGADRRVGAAAGIVALLPSRGAPTCNDAVTPAARGARRARVLVSGAAVAAVVTAALLGLLVAGIVARTGPAAPLFHGLTATGTAGAAVGLLALARAGALAGAGSVRRARTLCLRCTAAAAATGVAAALAGALTAPRVGSPLPAWGGAVALFLLALLVALALRLRASTGADAPPRRGPDRRGGGGESEPDRTAGAR